MAKKLPEITVAADAAELALKGADLVLGAVRTRPKGLVCLATGDSPRGLYAGMAAQPEAFQRTRFLKLDEWGGIPADDPSTCQTYIERQVLTPMGLPKERLDGFDPENATPEAECARIRGLVAAAGGLDLCILGMGADGHIGLNYPAAELPPTAHVTGPETLRHAMLQSARTAPTHGMTLGMAEVLQARMIVLVINGVGKAEAAARLLHGPITTQFPASLLWMHPNLHCLLDAEAAAKLQG